jgi:hypothetical protein
MITHLTSLLVECWIPNPEGGERNLGGVQKKVKTFLKKN